MMTLYLNHVLGDLYCHTLLCHYHHCHYLVGIALMNVYCYCMLSHVAEQMLVYYHETTLVCVATRDTHGSHGEMCAVMLMANYGECVLMKQVLILPLGV